jgi:hypothetical protein
MGARGPRHLRQTTNVVLDALVTAVEQAAHGQPLSKRMLEDIVAGLKVSPGFDDFYRHCYRELMDIVENERLEQRRTNPFGRLVIHALGKLFDQGNITRDLLPNTFSFIHLVLGDEADIYGERCHDILKSLKDDLRDDFIWDAFYSDPRSKLILWHTLVRIAASFKRWDVRKDWFIKLMQYRPTTVSLGSNAFVTREHDAGDEHRVFGEREFCQFFHALFEPLKDLPPSDDVLFRKEFGADPHHLIGPFLVNLTMCAV